MQNMGTTLLTIVEFVLVFGFLVFLHELGHFVAARLNRITVEEFGFGYPPRIFRLFKAWGAEFTLNWIPFGGFCRMKGEEGKDNEPGSFPAAKPWRRFLTLIGGPVTNLIVGLLIIASLFTRTGAPDTTKVQISMVEPNTPAALGGLEVGDQFVSINGKPVNGMIELSNAVSSHLGSPIEIVFLRNGVEMKTMITPRVEWPEDQGPTGIMIMNPVIKLNFFQALPQAAVTTINQGAQLFMLPIRLISGQIAPSDARVLSVKGIYDVYAQVQTIDKEEAESNPEMAGLNTIWFFAVISIALGFTNLLPIPALDGGRILFLIPELLFKKKVPPALEGKIHMVTYALLLTLMVVLVINDVINPVVLPK